MADNELNTGGDTDTSEGFSPNDVAPSSDVPASSSPASTAPAKTGQKLEQGGQDWEVKYRAQEKSYNELRKKLNEQGVERNEYRKRFEELTTQQKQILEALSKATERPYDPDQFMEELKAQGPNYFKKLSEQQLEKERQTWQQERDSLKSEIEAIQTERAVDKRKADTERYPNFAELEGEMVAILNANQNFYLALPSIEERVDALYNQAVLRHSQDALKVAGQLGQKKAEESLANEARSGVAGGGKTSGSPAVDVSKLKTSAEMRKHFVSQIGEAND